jgi:hypothetical protein
MVAEIEKVRETYDRELDAKYAVARNFVDAMPAVAEAENVGTLHTDLFSQFGTVVGVTGGFRSRFVGVPDAR